LLPKTRELIARQEGILEGADKQRQNTAAQVFSYIIDHGEIIPEEECLNMLDNFLKNEQYNKIDISEIK